MPSPNQLLCSVNAQKLNFSKNSASFGLIDSQPAGAHNCYEVEQDDNNEKLRLSNQDQQATNRAGLAANSLSRPIQFEVDPQLKISRGCSPLHPRIKISENDKKLPLGSLDDPHSSKAGQEREDGMKNRKIEEEKDKVIRSETNWIDEEQIPDE